MNIPLDMHLEIFDLLTDDELLNIVQTKKIIIPDYFWANRLHKIGIFEINNTPLNNKYFYFWKKKPNTLAIVDEQGNAKFIKYEHNSILADLIAEENYDIYYNNQILNEKIDNQRLLPTWAYSNQYSRGIKLKNLILYKY